MRIAIPAFGCDGGRSGVGQYARHLFRAMAPIAQNHEIDLIVQEGEQAVFMPPGDPYNLAAYPARIGHPLINIAWHQAGLPLRCLAKRYDAVFLPAANRRVPVWLPCPSVGAVHDFSSIHVAGKYDPARMFYIKQVLPFLNRRLSTIVTFAEVTKKDIVEYARVPEKRVHVIPHGVDHTIFYPRDKAAAANRMAARHGVRAPYILYISRIEHPGKNHVRLIEAFTRFKARSKAPHQLVLAGSDWTRAEEVHRCAEASASRADIHFTGFFPGEDMPDLYAGSDLFIFPSLFEGFGMPLLEAMACGVPLACSNISSLPEVAGDAGQLFDPYDVDAIAAAIEVFISDDAIRETHVRRGLARAKAYTWEASARKTLDLLLAFDR